MCRHPELYRLQAGMNCSELTVTAELVTKGARVLVSERCRAGDGAFPGCLPSQRGLEGWQKPRGTLLQGRCHKILGPGPATACP